MVCQNNIDTVHGDAYHKLRDVSVQIWDTKQHVKTFICLVAINIAPRGHVANTLFIIYNVRVIAVHSPLTQLFVN